MAVSDVVAQVTGYTEWFLRTYRYPLDEALSIARRIAPKIKVNGLTAANILAMDEQREKETDRV